MTDTVLTTMSRLVTAARKRHQLTQREVAARAGVCPNTVYLIEAGANPTLDTLVKVGAVVGITVEIRNSLG
jgi:DNA-binding XRE family transcriptional regulator